MKFIKHLIFDLIIFIALLFLIYPIKLVFCPIPSRLILGCIGILVAAYDIYNKNGKITSFSSSIVSKKFYVIAASFLIVCVISLVSSVINACFDVEFFKPIVLDIASLFGAYPIALLIKKNNNNQATFLTFAKYFVFVVVFQILLGLSMFLNPRLSEFIHSLWIYNATHEKLMGGYRIIGFGMAFFGAGIINAFTLVLISILLCTKKLKQAETLYFITSYIITFAIGMAISRTTIAGFFFSILVFIVNIKSFSIIKYQKIGISIFILLFLCGIIISGLSYDNVKKIEPLWNFGFQLFHNFINGRGFQTSSSNGTIEMMIFPDTCLTWLIGDAKFATATGYYKGTDVGYSRSIFYFGLIGLFSLMLAQGSVLIYVFKKINVFFIMIFGLYLVLNLKGQASLIPSISLFLFASSGLKDRSYDDIGRKLKTMRYSRI